MTGDRRRADNRRGKSGDSDRRDSDDRRFAESRRASESDVQASTSSKKRKKSSRSSGRTAGKSKIDWTKWFKRVAMVFMLGIIFFTATIIYFFSHLDFYVNKLGQRVKIDLAKATMDPESLTDRTPRAKLNFSIQNTLPLEVVLQNLNLNLHLSGYTVAKGTQITPKVLIKGHGATIVPVACSVDSIMTRRGLQKAMETSSAMSQKGAQAPDVRVADDLKGFIRIDGTAEFRLLVAGVEIPFTRLLTYEKRH